MREPEDTRPPPSHVAVLAAIAIGGALGAPARYGIAQLVPFTPGTFPWGTFWTNLSGAFVLGFFLAYLTERFPPSHFIRPFFGIGFLGAYTTFSTMAVETARSVKDGHVALGIGYTLVSIATGLVVAYLGMVSARALPGRRVRVPTIDEDLEG